MLNSLNISQTGLSAARTAVENVSNNIANQNTAGYKKRITQLSEISQLNAISGSGVNANSTYRVTSQYMYDKLINENTKSNYTDKLSSLLGNVESVFAETADSGFSSDLNRYFQSIENLRSNPSSQMYKSAVKTQGSILADSIKNLYTSVQQQQSAEKTDLNANVDKVNGILNEIGGINEKIQKYGETNDLLDKRDSLEQELSNYADISVDRRNNSYELKMSGETVISSGTNVRDISLIEKNINQVDKFNYTNYNPTTKITSVIDSIKNNYDPATGTVTPKLDANDKVTYKLNNQAEVSVTMGETLSGDWDNDPTTPNTQQVVDANNLTRALVLKINADTNMKDYVTAYNGDYALDSNGNKVLNTTEDKYLRIESKLPGTQNSFEGRISIEKRDNIDPLVIDGRIAVSKNDSESKSAESTVSLGALDKPINLKSGIIKAQIENLSSNSSSNKYQSYMDKLDSFVQTLSDITDKYVKTGTNTYLYGEAATDSYNDFTKSVNSIGLFSGSSVKTFQFNSSAVDGLDQEKLDYLSSIQWKKDLSFKGTSQTEPSNQKSSLSEFFNNLKISVSSDKENINFQKETQDNVKQSIQSSYDQLTKVDNDEEMLNLVKFQSAYTANAKIITAVNEMIQTLLGMK